MKPDVYTKVVLTVIALVLVVIAAKPLLKPDTTVNAQSTFSGVQFSSSDRGYAFFDPRTGDLWSYRGDITHFRLTKLGGRLVELQ
jgi:hypothetical protein